MTLEEENVRVPIKFPYPESEQFHVMCGLDVRTGSGVECERNETRSNF